MDVNRVHIPPEPLAESCRRHRIRKLSLFGPVLRDDFTADSDVDVLVEFEPDAVPGLLRFAARENELSSIVCRKVDFNTPAGLSK